MIKKDLKTIIEHLKNDQFFAIYSHMQPDGDSIGSLLALGEALQDAGKRVFMFSPNKIPAAYAFLHGADRVLHELIDLKKDITNVVLDCSDIERLGMFKETVLGSRVIINIDHHVTNQLFGTANLVDTEAAATGEIIFRLLRQIEFPISSSIAKSLYVAISTDTGSFKYENTTPVTHRIIADLLEHDIKPAVISQRIFDEKPLRFFMLLRDALSTLELYKDGQIALMTLSEDILKRNGASSDDLEGIVNFTRNIEGVELGILFYLGKDEQVKVGFRSKTLDVSKLAGRLNGGGHSRAAGCRLQGEYEQQKDRVLSESFKMIGKG